MNPRERLLAMAVLGVLVAAGASFLFHQLFLQPLWDSEASIQALREQIDGKRKQQQQILADKPRLERFRQLSLPPDADPARRDFELARREYVKYLSQLLLTSGFAPGSFTVTPTPLDTRSIATGAAAKKLPYTRLPFTVQGNAKLENIVRLLEGFYGTGLLHQIKSLSCQLPQIAGPEQRPGELVMSLKVEGLVVEGAFPRQALLPNIDPRLLAADLVAGLLKGSPALGLVAWAVGPAGPRGPGILARPLPEYAAIASKNIFTGPPPEAPKVEVVEVTRYVYLTDVTHDDRYFEAWLQERYTQGPFHYQRLRNMPGFDQFRIKDNTDKVVIIGKVVRMDLRDIIFRANGTNSPAEESFFPDEPKQNGTVAKHYRWHVGQSLGEALQTPLSPDEVDRLLKEPAEISLKK
jgi:hypothetical protein